jgi:hypothetical protein
VLDCAPVESLPGVVSRLVHDFLEPLLDLLIG